MGPSEKDDGYVVTLAIPDITQLADEELAAFAPFRDGAGAPKQRPSSHNSQQPSWILIAAGHRRGNTGLVPAANAERHILRV